MVGLELWFLFGGIVIAALVIDLGFLQGHGRAHVIGVREAALWYAVWVALAIGFAAVLYGMRGRQPALEFLTGYIIEQSLSVDNMFVFVLIFEFFRIPHLHQPRVLKWGILSAIAMRFAIIFAGVALLNRFHWVLYLFGGILLVTAFRLLREEEKEIDPSHNPVLRLFQRFMPISSKLEGDFFFTRNHPGSWMATPLFAALLVVEVSDLVFAVDSIPAVLAITRDPFIVFTSNIFAILGLRSLYFLISGLMRAMCYLRYGLALVLFFIGGKMLLMDVIPIPIGISLTVVAVLMGASIGLSLWRKP